MTLTFDLLTLKVVSKSHVTWATSVPILVFLGLSVLGLGPMYATDRETPDRRQTALSLNTPPIRGRGIITTSFPVGENVRNNRQNSTVADLRYFPREV